MTTPAAYVHGVRVTEPWRKPLPKCKGRNPATYATLTTGGALILNAEITAAIPEGRDKFVGLCWDAHQRVLTVHFLADEFGGGRIFPKRPALTYTGSVYRFSLFGMVTRYIPQWKGKSIRLDPTWIEEDVLELREHREGR